MYPLPGPPPGCSWGSLQAFDSSLYVGANRAPLAACVVGTDELHFGGEDFDDTPLHTRVIQLTIQYQRFLVRCLLLLLLLLVPLLLLFYPVNSIVALGRTPHPPPRAPLMEG